MTIQEAFARSDEIRRPGWIGYITYDASGYITFARLENGRVTKDTWMPFLQDINATDWECAE